ncbi:MAG: sugar phosphate isomerase/epimerase family protein [Terriglobia bacterium]
MRKSQSEPASKALSRRDLLRLIPALGIAAALPAGLYAAAEPHLDFPTRPRERLAVTSYPFRAWLVSPANRAREPKKPGLDMCEFPEMIARRFGVHNVNPLGDHFASTAPAYLDKFRNALAAARSHLVGLGLGGAQFWDPDPARVEAAVEYGKKWIDIAAALGSPSVRQHLRGSHGVAPDVNRAASSLGRLAEYGAKKNVVVNLENDSPVNENPFFIVKVIEQVRNPYLRGLPDFGNSIRGQDAAYNQRAVAAMFRHAFNMSHIKDALAGEGGSTYKIDLARMFGIAKRSGYRGYFSMEWDTSQGDPYDGTRRLIRESLQYLG